MSGICGTIRLDGRNARDDDVAVMVAALHRRGPDRSGIACAGPAALGHALLATTPESAAEPMPFIHPASGCMITADARLDNRAELIAALGIDPRGRMIGDGDLIVQAYLKWGTDCTERLLGDFAFAIWDARCRRLFAARDHTGMRQLIHHHRAGHLFAFASEADAIARHPDIPREINELRIADYLEDMESADLTSTFFRGTFRLPPAHALTLADGQLTIWRYWHPDPPQILRLGSDAAYSEALRAVLGEAVEARLRSPKPVGAMLSGGMDSGSVAALGAQWLKHQGAPPLPTFSAATSDPGCVESRAIRLAQRIDHIDPHTILLEDMADYGAELARLTWDSSEPFDGHMAMVRAVYMAARKAGHKVVLDGVGGDTTLQADNMIAYHLRAARLTQAWHEAAGEARFWGEDWPAHRTFISGARYAFIPQVLRDLRGKVEQSRIARNMDAKSLLAPEFARRIMIGRRRAQNKAHVAVRTDGACRDRRRLALHPYIILGRERYDRVAAQQGIEPRDPFMDRRVVDFCLSMPPEQLQQNGWAKFVLRKAMAGLLPDGVRWRLGKQHVGGLFLTELARQFPCSPTASAAANTARYARSAGNPGRPTGSMAPSNLENIPNLEYLTAWFDVLLTNF